MTYKQNSFKNLIESSIYKYLPDKDKQDIQWLRTINPKLFEEQVPTKITTPESQKRETSYGEYKTFGEQAGVDTEKIEAEKDKRGFWTKLFAAVNTAPRAMSAMSAEQGRQIGADEFKKYGFLYKPPLEKGKTYTAREYLDATKKYQDLKAPTDYKKIWKSGWEALINKKESEYQDWTWGETFKETRPDWKPWQQATAGLTVDIFGDPLTTLPVGKVFSPLNKIIGGKLAATALGQGVKASKLGKYGKLILKALSFKKAPVTDIANKLRREEIYSMTKTVDLLETLIKKTNSAEDAIAITKYLTDPKKYKLSPELTDVAGSIKKLFGEFATEETEKGILKEVLENYVPGRVPSNLMSKLPKGGKISALGAKFQPFQQPKVFKDILKRAEYGIPTEQNIFKLAVKRSSEHYKALTRLRMVDEMAEFGKKAIDLTPIEKANIKNMETGFKELKELYFEPEVARVIKRIEQFSILDEPTNLLLKAYDKTLNLLKGYMTVTNPGFHMRNLYSNYWLLYLKDGVKAFDPISHVDAITIQLAKRRPDKFINLGSKIIKADELYEISGKLGVRRTGFIRSDVAESLSQRLDWLLKPKAQRIFAKFNPLSREFAPMKGGDFVGGFIEDNARLVGWVNDLKRGFSFEDAARNTKKFMIDYTDLSLFEKNVLKRIYPFYAWTRKNSILQAEQLFKQPGKFGLNAKLKNYIESFSEDVDDKYLPDYYEDLAAIRTPIKIGGQPLYFNPNFPWQDLSKLTRPRELLSGINPMLKVPAELLLNRESYFGRDINVPGQLKPAPRYMQGLGNVIPFEKFLPGAEKSKEGQLFLTGRQEYLTRQIPFIYNIHKILPPEAEAEAPVKTKYITDTLSALAGIKFFPYDEEKNKTYYYEDLISRINVELKQKRILGEDVPSISQYKSALKEMYGIAVGQKYDIEQIKKLENLLQLTGSSAETNQFLKLIKKPYQEEMSKTTDADLLEIKKMLNEMGITYSLDD
ncbi:MAG: hypothetical protein HQ569_04485, partial [Actinobacteria bacterium]|nr:hypothetical protein [Actinomycetota bacterium]